MALARAELDRLTAKGRDELDRRTNHVDAETVPGDDLLIAACMKIGKAVGKLDLLAVEGERAICRLGRRKSGRQIGTIDRQEPAHAGAPAFEITRRAADIAEVHDAAAI